MPKEYMSIIKRRVKREILLQILLMKKEHEFRDDANYNQNMVEDGFANRLIDAGETDFDMLERISVSYNKAIIAQKKVASCYLVSNEWLPIYESYLGEVINLLKEKNLVGLNRVYKNFFRDKCSTGLVGLPMDMEKNFFKGNITTRNKKRFLFDVLHRFKLWKSFLGKTHTVQDLKSPIIGNPYGYVLDGEFIRVGADYHHYYATAIGRLVQSKKRATVVELGGGYGGMAYYLCRDNVNISYIDLELPENLALTAYYLIKSFPDKKIVLYGEAELTDDCIAGNDIILMPNFEIDKIADNSCDLVFNSHSLAEMSKEAIDNYIDYFNGISKKYIFHINHIKNSMVGADDFPIDYKKYHLLYKTPALWNGGARHDMDEYEYLFKKY